MGLRKPFNKYEPLMPLYDEEGNPLIQDQNIINEELIRRTLADTQEPAPDMNLPSMSDQDVINNTIADVQKEEQNSISPSPEPGKTAALETPLPENEEDAIESSVEPTSQTRQKPETDEFEPMFKKYQEDLGKIQSEQEAEDKALQEAESRVQTATGIAGALQAFGEGLAAITGGSAKPLQIGAETLRRSAGQELDAKLRRGKSLKERIELSREPLETKATELKFRDVFEKRQAQKRLNDPESKESADARDMASNFLDVYVANLQNKAVDPEAIQRVEGVRSKIAQMNANQIQKFLDNLKEIKFGTSFETTMESKKELEQRKEESKIRSEDVKYERKLQDQADKRFLDDSAKLAVTVKEAKKFSDQLSTFQKQVEAAKRGDRTALEQVKRNRGVINYLIARQNEPRGVFTDQDLAALSQFEAGKGWSETFQGWFSKGLANISPKDLDRILGVLQDTIPIYQDAETKVIEQTKRLYKASDNKFLNQKADRLTPELFGLGTTSKGPKNGVSPSGRTLIQTGE